MNRCWNSSWMEGIWINPTIVQRECKCGKKTGRSVGSSSKRHCPLVCVSYLYIRACVCVPYLYACAFLHSMPVEGCRETPHGRRNLGSRGGVFMCNCRSLIYLTFCQGMNTIWHVYYSSTELGKKEIRSRNIKIIFWSRICVTYLPAPLIFVVNFGHRKNKWMFVIGPNGQHIQAGHWALADLCSPTNSPINIE